MIKTKTMKNMILILLMGSTLYSFGQISVTARNFPNGDTATMRLDHTIVVDYTITAGTTLRNVLPTLIPPPCAVVGGAPIINCTTNLTQPITQIPTGSSVTVRFYVHLYEESNICGSDNPYCSGGLLDFSMVVQSDEGQFFANDLNHYLEYTVPENDILSLDFVCSERVTPISLLDSATGFLLENVYDVNSSGYDLQDSDTRIFLYIDWQAQSSTPWVVHTISPAAGGSPTPCYFSFLPPLGTGAIEQFSGIAEDRTSANPEDWHIITQSAVGGAGGISEMTKGIGVNLFDVSSLNTSCSSSIRNDIGYNLSQNYFALVNLSHQVLIREMKLMLGHYSNCVADFSTFMAPPSSSEFYFSNLFYSTQGNVQGTLQVPASWKSGANLKSNYSVHWYLRSDHAMIDLGGSGQVLTFNGSAGTEIDDFSNYRLEARVTYDDGTRLGVVSTSSAGPGFGIELDDLEFSMAEDFDEGYDPDQFLDPGEEVSVGIILKNQGTLDWPFDVNDVAFGYKFNSHFIYNNAVQASGPNIKLVDKTIAGSVSNNQRLELAYELLEAGGMSTADLVVEVTANSGGTQVTLQKVFSMKDLTGLALDLDQEYSRNFEDFNFDGTDFYTFDDSVLSYQTKSRVDASGGWIGGVSGYWYGSTGTSPEPQDWDNLYVLKSPRFQIGDSMVLRFNHQPGFTFNQSGGVLEYALVNSNGQTIPGFNWRNVSTITNSNIYDPIAFPTNFDSYLSGQACWMNDAETIQMVNTTLNTSAFTPYFGNENVFIQFRFIFEDPSLNPHAPTRSSGTTDWQVESFYFESYSFKRDNFFLADIRDVNNPVDSCHEELEVTLNRQSPFAISDLGYGWYDSLASIYAGASATIGSGEYGNGFPASFTPQSKTYWVKLTNPDLETERIIPFTVLVPDGFLSQGEALQSIWNDQPGWQAQDKRVLDFVGVINLVCEP